MTTDCGGTPHALLPEHARFFDHPFIDYDAQVISSSALLEVGSPPGRVRSAIAAVTAHHESLRSSYPNGPAGRRILVHEHADEVDFQVIDLTDVEPRNIPEYMDRVRADIARPIPVDSAPLSRYRLVVGPPGAAPTLLRAGHHLEGDALSGRIFAEDVATAWGQLSAGQEVALPPPSANPQQIAARLQNWARTPEALGIVDYWRDRLHHPSAPPPGHQRGPSLFGQSESVSQTLAVGEDRVLQTRARYRLLGAIALAWAMLLSGDRIRLQCVGTGRRPFVPNLDLKRVVGWLSPVFPLDIQVDRHARPRMATSAVLRALRGLPHRGESFDAAKYLVPGAKDKLPDAQVLFNYLGRTVSGDYPGLSHAPDAVSGHADPRAEREYPVSITSWEIDGALKLEWWYSTGSVQAGAIQEWAELVSALWHEDNSDSNR